MSVRSGQAWRAIRWQAHFSHRGGRGWRLIRWETLKLWAAAASRRFPTSPKLIVLVRMSVRLYMHGTEEKGTQ
ncbi:hypothetical protein KIN20_036705 [Parelaphostrongylus tenuis]|uniref:Uncharacterized protein n=1 Tax=Parelaphostrongylus tenuis TaxID=148309 RepID=A0AAD5WLH5_PARTN|nr:hypothetical protein KIN20_036705 [Parelaphostrongylus tenuis]